MNYAFIDDHGVVVNLICGILTEGEKSRFVRDYKILFGATSVVQVDGSTSVWIGGSYDSESGTFNPPPSLEPEPIVEEPINVDPTI